MADKKNLCAMIPADLHARVRQEQEQSGQTLSEFVEQLITDYYKMKENTKMTGDMRTMAIQLPEELFGRLKAYLKKNNLKQKQFIIGTMIFDEVDAGVSGRAAQKVAYKLWTVAKGRQVLCVTHLPQIAAMADTEFTVEKSVENGRTYTSVLRLDEHGRRQELARLTGGSMITETTLAGAAELLRLAEQTKKGV